MRTRSPNPFLPKSTSVGWRKGPFAKKPTAADQADQTDPPPPPGAASSDPEMAQTASRDKGAEASKRSSQKKHVAVDPQKIAATRAFPNAGKLSLETGAFFSQSNSGWGSNLDMVPLSHGPVGCGAIPQTFRPELPGFAQGIESFTTMHACTNLGDGDFEDSGNAKLARALDEINTLFPLAQGVTIISEDPVALIDANIGGVAKAKAKELDRLIIPLSRGSEPAQLAVEAAALEAAARRHGHLRTTAYDVAVPFYREATGLVWIVSKLLREIGLNPVHQITGSSSIDMARIHQCKLVIGIAHRLDVPLDYKPRGYAQLLRQWYGMPIVWACFLGPSAMDASLRAIAAHFDSRIQDRVEQVIAANRKKIDAVIARYRPRLQGKLVVDFDVLPETLLESYRLLGMRVGNATGWPGKMGVSRTPRLICDRKNATEKSIDSYIAEARPDLVLYFKRDEYDWSKRGQSALPYSPFFDTGGNAFWAYDGFACLAAALDRHLNAPWRKLLKPPWPIYTA